MRSAGITEGSAGIEIIPAVLRPENVRSGGCGQAIGGIEVYSDGRLIDKIQGRNVQCDAQCTSILDVVYHNQVPIHPWYIVPFENDYAPDGTETYANPGATECTAYDEASRQQWQEAAASAKSITNSANKAGMTMSASKMLYGIMLLGGGTSAITKGDTAGGGILGHIIRFAAVAPVEAGHQIKLWATIAQNSGS